jgi:hypothetical protein
VCVLAKEIFQENLSLQQKKRQSGAIKNKTQQIFPDL